MSMLARSDTSSLGRWWWTVDHVTYVIVLILAGLGVILVQAASPAVAWRYGLDSFHFVVRHMVMLIPALLLAFAISLLRPSHVLRLASVMMCVTLVLIFLIPFIGTSTKGAMRWINFYGFSIQPSEFMKPALIVVSAWLFSRYSEISDMPSLFMSIALLMLVALGLLLQPDIGMTFLVSSVWLGMFFLAGMHPMLLGAVIPLIGVAGFGAYSIFPHFASRVNRFLEGSGDTYQVDRALDAFRNGGIWGAGPGEGSVKMVLPDAHADFVFAVAGEEMGLIGCIAIVALFAILVLRGLKRLSQEKSVFHLIAVSGLLMELGLQAIINMSSALHLIPAKGMTLPFISHGGSSLIALGIAVGMLLALTRKRYDTGN